ncbi:DUF7563 family protein [Natrinema pallidum]|uniref:Small CPxCG-related zinc finger protein n=1 Tax=Natrinema pallidum DSM 3751 TaxID=1227495 RepID=L9YHP8_9EURY|nr:hypothetical protein C487_17530 [Natrinema pallidum DSM 3751]
MSSDDSHASRVAAQLAEAEDADLETPTEDDRTRSERPQWTPTGTESASAPTCQNCGAQVTPRFARVFGDNDDIAHACPDCTDNRRLARDAAQAGGGLR